MNINKDTKFFRSVLQDIHGMKVLRAYVDSKLHDAGECRIPFCDKDTCIRYGIWFDQSVATIIGYIQNLEKKIIELESKK